MAEPPLRDPPSRNGLREALESAVRALRSGRASEAERRAAEVLSQDGDNLVAAQILGEALLVQNRAREAVAVLEAPAAQVGDAATLTLLGMALQAAGRPEEALSRFRQAAERRPLFPLAAVRLADGLADLGRFPEAVAALNEALAATPAAAADPLRLSLAHIHLRRGDRASARRLLAALAQTAPTRGVVVALARVLALDGDFAGAAELYGRALRAGPDDVLTRIALGKCLLETGNRDAGEAHLRAAAGQGPMEARLALEALAATPHGRFFLRPSDAARFMGLSER